MTVPLSQVQIPTTCLWFCSSFSGCRVGLPLLRDPPGSRPLPALLGRGAGGNFLFNLRDGFCSTLGFPGPGREQLME